MHKKFPVSLYEKHEIEVRVHLNQHSLENTALRMENTALLVMCIAKFELLKVAKTNNLLTRNTLKQLKSTATLVQYEKIALGCGSHPIQHSASSHTVLVSRPHALVLFFHIVLVVVKK